MHKIYFNNLLIRFCSLEDHTPLTEDSQVETYQNMIKLIRVFKKFVKQEKKSHLLILCSEPTFIFKDFIKCFDIIKAAGGLVQNEEYKKYLFIYRYDHWDLPKGKKEAKEKIKETALREVEEETGVQNLKITSKLPTSYHFMVKKERYIVKKCYWFAMSTDDTQKLKPQKEEAIQKAIWLNSKTIRSYYPKMYASIRGLCEEFFDEL